MNKNSNKFGASARRIAVMGVLSAFSILLSLIPSLGYIPVPPLPITITTMHVPVIIAGILERSCCRGLCRTGFWTLESVYCCHICRTAYRPL